jgi:hypothetical protein
LILNKKKFILQSVTENCINVLNETCFNFPDEVIAEEEKADDTEKVDDIESQLKEVKLELPLDNPVNEEIQEEPAEIKEPESEIKTEPEEKETEEGIGEEDVKAIAPAVDTTHAAVACSIDGNVKFEDSPQITPGPIPGKIKINITKSIPSGAAKEFQSEGEAETSTTDQSNDNESSTVPAEASRESGEEGIGEDDVDSQEPPPPGVEPVQLKPRLVGRKLTELPPVMKGTELSGLCSIM